MIKSLVGPSPTKLVTLNQLVLRSLALPCVSTASGYLITSVPVDVDCISGSAPSRPIRLIRASWEDGLVEKARRVAKRVERARRAKDMVVGLGLEVGPLGWIG